MKGESIHVGDFAYCRSKYYRSQLQLREEPGLVIEIKRSNFKILFPGDKRCWLPRETLIRVRPEPDATGYLHRLHYILKRVHAHECELISDDGTHRLSARIDKIDTSAVDDLRQYLGDGFVSLQVVPEGMAFMQVEVVFTGTPGE